MSQKNAMVFGSMLLAAGACHTADKTPSDEANHDAQTSSSGTGGSGNGGGGGGGSQAKPWERYIYAPERRTLNPVAVHSTNGSVVNPENVLSGQATELVGNGAYIVLDFGKEVGGIVTLTFSAASDADQKVGLAFSESALYVGPESDKSNGGSAPDGAIYAPAPGASSYTMPKQYLRGGFRYLTVFLSSAGWVHLIGVSLDYSPDPSRATPNQYPNYFYSNDDTLNKAWYAGAYTFQTNLVRKDEGRVWPPAAYNWDNSATIGELGDVVLTDAAKRDRTIWPGDMGIAVPTGYVSLFELESAKNSLHTLYNHQGDTGGLPYAGPPMNFGGSDTYHMWSLLGTHLYYLYSGDKPWLDSVWSKFKLGVEYSFKKLSANGLMSVTDGYDWARDNQGGENIAANAMLYGVLTQGADLAKVEGDATLASTYRGRAAELKSRINAVLWDTSRGAYKDNPSSTLYPQDGNALAVWFNVVDSAAQAKSISYVLNENWNDKGSRGPEFTLGTGTRRISTFAGSMELMSHFEAGYATLGLEMIRTMWGFMLSSPNGTASTIWEGFNSDGSFAYQGSYTSLSHAWGSGPTSALTFYVLGIQPETAAGQTYRVIPHPGDLTHVEGNLTLAPGKVVYVEYDVGSECKTFSMRVNSEQHPGSTGTIGVPRFGANHSVLINGVEAWDGSHYLGATGVGDAHQDADTIYFTGVQAGARTFLYGDGASCPAAPEQWTFCSDEGGTCAFSGAKRVRFGKNGKYNYKRTADGAPCNVATFGDPLTGALKSCQFSSELYAACADEGQTCAFSGQKEVRFGANGQWITRVASGGTACDSATFGDPLPNVAKRCETRDVP